MNTFVEKFIKERHNVALDDIASILTAKFPNLESMSKNTIHELYEACISIRQQHTQRNGNHFEECIKTLLTDNSIAFKQQVIIDNKGVICLGQKKKCNYILDFVIGDVEEGRSITEYIVVSCKTTCRERWTQDNWTMSIRPKKYILMTLSEDYPPSKRFQENFDRKIISLKSKKKDDRHYKLTFDNLITELVAEGSAIKCID